MLHFPHCSTHLPPSRPCYNPPVRRRILTLISVVSLLLFTATAVLWVRSYWVYDRLGRRTQDARRQLQGFQSLRTSRGSIHWTVGALDGRQFPALMYEIGPKGRVRVVRVTPGTQPSPNAPLPPFEWTRFPFQITADAPLYNPARGALGFGRTTTTYTGTVEAPDHTQSLRNGTLQDTVIPLYAFATFFAVPPLLWFAAILRRASRTRRNLCPACGYNLTGNTSGVCPECGTAVAGKATA